MNATNLTARAPASGVESEFIEKKRPLLQQAWKARTSYLMLLPFLIPFVLFTIWPILSSLYLSTTSYNGVAGQPIESVGLQNYGDLLTLEIKPLALMLDETTNEQMYQCGRSRVPESELAAAIAEGRTCELAYQRPREVLTEGNSEFTRLSFAGTMYVVGAKDPRFWTAMVNTGVYVVSTVFLSTIFGLLLAVVLQRQTRLNMFMRIIFFLPSVTSAVAITVVWGWMFRGQEYGLINAIVTRLGGEVIDFLADPVWSMPIIVLIAVWGGMGYNMILFLAGLQSIPEELYEAAMIDGANADQRFWGITLPLLRPTLIYIVVTGVISAFQVFQSIYVLYGGSEGVGGPLDSALAVVVYLYEEGFRLFNLGYASAIAWILFLIIFVLTLVNLRVGRANEAY